MPKPLLILLGPAPPYKGGISDTNFSLYKELNNQNYNTLLWTFKVQYPSFLFRKSQFSNEIDISVDFPRKIHSYNVKNWKNIAKEINALNPEKVAIRCWTPFLYPCWIGIVKRLNKNIEIIAIVDNWKPHERIPIFDTLLIKKLEKYCHRFVTFSQNVATQIQRDSKKPVLTGFHPINTTLVKKIPQSEAKEKLHLKQKTNYVLFAGIIRKYKGLQNLIKAFNEPCLKDKNIELLIAGEFYEPLKKYNRLIKDNHLENKITLFPYYIPSKELSYFFCASDVVVLPYLKATQSGIVSLAYFYNTPLIVSKIKGLQEIITSDKTGIAIDCEPKEIAKSIVNYFSENAKENFQKNISKIVQNYSWKNFTLNFITFLKKI